MSFVPTTAGSTGSFSHRQKGLITSRFLFPTSKWTRPTDAIITTDRRRGVDNCHGDVNAIAFSGLPLLLSFSPTGRNKCWTAIVNARTKLLVLQCGEHTRSGKNSCVTDTI